MNQEFFKKLSEMAYNNAHAHQLLQLWMRRDISYEDWSNHAIIHLLIVNDVLAKAALDAELRANPRPMIIPKDDES